MEDAVGAGLDVLSEDQGAVVAGVVGVEEVAHCGNVKLEGRVWWREPW